MNDLTIALPHLNEEVVERLPDNAQWRLRFKIRSGSSNRVYIIAQNKASNGFACSCPGWKRWRVCKHLTDGCRLLPSQIHGNNALSDGNSRKARRIS